MNGIKVYADFRKNQKPRVEISGEKVKPGAVEIIMLPESDIDFIDRFELVIWSKSKASHSPQAMTLKPFQNGFRAAAWLPAGSYEIDIEAYTEGDAFSKGGLYAANCGGLLEVG